MNENQILNDDADVNKSKYGDKNQYGSNMRIKRILIKIRITMDDKMRRG